MHLIHDQKNGRQQIWVSVEDYGHGKVWEFHVHGAGTRDSRTVHSIGMACELIGADPRPLIEACPALANDGPA
ncbi:MAG: hypothetical protein KDG54_19210 [Geminicoccaceae bacterium]|nr:hypothetical protein [Geminicoccaceae bacterium]